MTTGVYSTLDKSPIRRLASARQVLRRRNESVPCCARARVEGHRVGRYQHRVLGKAAAAAVEKAASSLRDLRIAQVAELDLQIESGVVKAYRAKVKVSFKYED
jgi:dodecin